MPPKAKLHNKNGKTKSFPRSTVNVPVQPSTSSEAQEPADTDAERKFEVELCWCIQQLEITLEKKNLNPKQVEESVKVLNVLKNNTQLPVKKRHLMRLHFGDYRTKMATEAKKAKKVNNQISFSDASTSSNKSTYLRKTAFLTTGDNSFKFNFNLPDENHEETDPNEKANINPDSENANNECGNRCQNFSNNLPLSFSSNPLFKFNFKVDDNA